MYRFGLLACVALSCRAHETEPSAPFGAPRPSAAARPHARAASIPEPDAGAFEVGTDAEGAGGSADSGEAPLLATERPFCRNRLEPSSALSSGECLNDEECRKRAHGRCTQVTLPRRLENQCIYEECASDADCRRGRCACDAKGVKRCLLGACRSDEHCPAGQRCQYENAYSGEGAKSFYLGQPYCTTPRDQCTPLNDSMCGQSGACTYSLTARRWQCNPRAIRGRTY
jgi:hypothetical protein